MSEEKILSATESICPECLARIPAVRVAREDRILLRKTCPEHGLFQAVIWSGCPSYSDWGGSKIPSFPESPFTGVEKGCPYDCGLCPDHRQQSCCTLIEVTQRCNLHCNVCFAGAGDPRAEDPGMDDIRGMYESLLNAGGPYNVQLSGGEPTLRDDLPEIIRLGRSLGFDFIQVNTNGLRLAEDPSYAGKLKDAGLACVFLQFDGLTDDIYEKLRGRPALKEKTAAVKHCADNELGVILVPTLVPGVNTHQIGAMIDFAVRRLPGVRGVHFQPVSYFGRYPAPPEDKERITIPEIIRAIEEQTGGRIRTEHFKPPGAENSFCSFHGNFVLLEDGELKPWTRHDPGKSCCKPRHAGEEVLKARRFVTQFWSCAGKEPGTLKAGPSLGQWEVFLERARTHSFCISGMAFQDAWNLDLDRLKDCCVHVVHPDGRIIPFCAYNITDRNGRSLYRKASLGALPQDRKEKPSSIGAEP